jgi:PKHD-type hydroxylase
VAVGWVRSYVRDPARRELLFDLETACRRLFDREGKTAEGDLLAKCAANLMRLWCDD